MGGRLLLIATVLCIVSVSNASLAPFIKPCKPSDSNCAVANANNAIPLFSAGLSEFKVDTLDPIKFDKVDSSTPNLKFIMNDITVQGLKGCKMVKLERDETTSKMQLRLECSVKLDGQYELTGNILILTVSGKGKVHAELDEAVFDLECDVVTKTGADGKDHWRIKRFRHTFDLPKESVVVFEDLFEGNDVLGQAADNLIKTSGSEIVKEIGGPMIKAAMTSVVKAINNFFSFVPVEQLTQ